MLVGTRLAPNPTAPASKLIPPKTAGESATTFALTAGEEQYHNQLAIFDPNGHLATRKPKKSRQQADSDSDAEEDIALGPVDPDACIVTGPGFAGGAAQATLSFKIHAKDANGRNLKEGGDYIIAKVIPGPTAASAGAEEQFIDIVDHANGTYTGTYSVPVRGDYKLVIDINGDPLGGSPFPLYFSPPEANPEPDNTNAATAASLPGLEPAAAAAAVAASLAPPKPSVGPAAVAAGVELPTNEEEAKRTVLVGNVSMLVVSDQLKALFSFAGEVLSCKIVGNSRQYAFVEYAKAEEADAAQAMHNMHVAGQPISVETCQYARETVEKTSKVVPANPLVAMQLQQLMSQPSVAAMQQQQRQLAEQVANMRAAQRANPTTTKVCPSNSVSQKAAALAAAAALAKKLGGKGPVGKSNADNDGGNRNDNKADGGRNDKNGDRDQTRSRRRSRSRSRDRSAERRRRDASRERRERDRRAREASRERRARDASRERREREKERDRGSREDRHRSPSGGSRKDRRGTSRDERDKRDRRDDDRQRRDRRDDERKGRDGDRRREDESRSRRDSRSRRESQYRSEGDVRSDRKERDLDRQKVENGDRRDRGGAGGEARREGGRSSRERRGERDGKHRERSDSRRRDGSRLDHEGVERKTRDRRVGDKQNDDEDVQGQGKKQDKDMEETTAAVVNADAVREGAEGEEGVNVVKNVANGNLPALDASVEADVDDTKEGAEGENGQEEGGVAGRKRERVAVEYDVGLELTSKKAKRSDIGDAGLPNGTLVCDVPTDVAPMDIDDKGLEIVAIEGSDQPTELQAGIEDSAVDGSRHKGRDKGKKSKSKDRKEKKSKSSRRD